MLCSKFCASRVRSSPPFSSRPAFSSSSTSVSRQGSPRGPARCSSSFSPCFSNICRKRGRQSRQNSLLPNPPRRKSRNISRSLQKIRIKKNNFKRITSPPRRQAGRFCISLFYKQRAGRGGRMSEGHFSENDYPVCAIGKRGLSPLATHSARFFRPHKGQNRLFCRAVGKRRRKTLSLCREDGGRGATAYCGREPAPAQNMGNSPNLPKFSKKSEKNVVFLLTFGVGYGIVIRLSQESSSKTPDKRSDRRNLSKNFQKT